jgi:hypothetical protein
VGVMRWMNFTLLYPSWRGMRKLYMRTEINADLHAKTFLRELSSGVAGRTTTCGCEPGEIG